MDSLGVSQLPRPTSVFSLPPPKWETRLTICLRKLEGNRFLIYYECGQSIFKGGFKSSFYPGGMASGFYPSSRCRAY